MYAAGGIGCAPSPYYVRRSDLETGVYVMTDLDNDRRSLLPDPNLSRRRMLAASLSSGFAMAVQPVTAQTMIVTDANGLTAGEVKVRAGDGEIPAYRAHAQRTGGPFPTILVVQEIFGVHEHIKDVCRRLAKAGYFAIAPELYARQGDVSKLSRHQRDPQPGRREGAGRAGDERPRRHRRLGQGDRQGRYCQARHHRLLLGRPHRLALCRAQRRT